MAKYRVEALRYGDRMGGGPTRKNVKFSANGDLEALQLVYIMAYMSHFRKPDEETLQKFAGLYGDEYDEEEDKTLLSFEDLAEDFNYHSEEVTVVLKNEAGKVIFSSSDEDDPEEEDWDE